MQLSRYCLILFCLLVMSHQSLAQNDRRETLFTGPKIGLVLSGGGAKGMAHVGALQVLEEIGIVPDYITGTSMGSLVGALYALGYTPDEMEELLITMPWDQILTNEMPLHNVTIEEKPYYGRYLVELPVNGMQVGLPRGALEGQKLSELFCKLTLSAHNIEDFSQLPIPFAAVAVDLPTGNPVVLNRGSLPEAMRASMAIPSVFTPILTDSTLLVDGGMVRNFPVKEVREMGADIVIGIDVSGGFPNPENIKTMVDVLMQSSFIMSNLDTEEQIRQVDLLIQPDITNYSASDFYSARAIINSGYEAASNSREQLMQLADSVFTLRPRHTQPEKLAVKDSFYIHQVIVKGNDKIPQAYIVGKLNITTNQWIEINEVEKSIELLHGTRYFNKITYEIRNAADGDDLIIKVEEAPDAFLRPALHYDTENGAGFILSYVHRNLLLPSSRLTVEADFAENSRIFFNYFKYLGQKQRFAAILGADYILNDISVGFATSERASGVYRNSWFNPYLRLQTSRFQNFTLGTEIGWETASLKPTVNTSQEVGDGLVFDLEQIKRFPYDSYQLGLYAQINTLDKPIFPTDGWHVDAKIEYVGGVKMTPVFFPEHSDMEGVFDFLFQFENTTRTFVEVQQFYPLTSSWTLESELVTSFSSGNHLSPYDQYLVGGFYPIFDRSVTFWGAKPYELGLKNFMLLREKGRFEFLPDLYAEGVVNLLVPRIDELNLDPLPKQAVLGYGIGLSYKSFLGPIQFSLAHQHNTDRWFGFFSLGYNFR